MNVLKSLHDQYYHSNFHQVKAGTTDSYSVEETRDHLDLQRLKPRKKKLVYKEGTIPQSKDNKAQDHHDLSTIKKILKHVNSQDVLRVYIDQSHHSNVQQMKTGEMDTYAM